MQHSMKLQRKYFQRIESGQKTVEMRLHDEKRQKIKEGDVIVFSDMENSEEKLKVRVTAISRFSTFDELYQNIPLSKLGYNTEEEQNSASAKDMEKFYPIEQQKEYGVMGIWIKNITIH